ncbi:2-dehydropantoate 2-reductase N-terminal domain-containing protein [Zhongshania marina]|uniref:2-dehydropantoate 2-reductase N-terminal domain-containing protein n=1 Tax=Zhongshania marina TaxID=2304603 RepID=UPI0011AFA5C0|nr:2-dehydropantoate 2-reductase N-terminal domain-containing protein [Marortus luteolus]
MAVGTDLTSDVRRRTSDSLKIGIAGAGLLGRLLAWKLLRQGHRVSLFDRGSRTAELSAAKVAASMLAPYSEVLRIIGVSVKIWQ